MKNRNDCKIIKNCDDNCIKCGVKDWCPSDNTISEEDKIIMEGILERAGIDVMLRGDLNKGF